MLFNFKPHIPSFAEIFLQLADFHGTLGIDLPPQIALEIKDLTILTTPWRAYEVEEVEGSGSRQLYSYPL